MENRERVETALAAIGWSKRELATRLGAPSQFVVYQRINNDGDLGDEILAWLESVAEAVNELPAPPAWQAKARGRKAADEATRQAAAEERVRKATKAKRQKTIARMRRNGISVKRISEELGVSRHVVARLSRER